MSTTFIIKIPPVIFCNNLQESEIKNIFKQHLYHTQSEFSTSIFTFINTDSHKMTQTSTYCTKHSPNFTLQILYVWQLFFFVCCCTLDISRSIWNCWVFLQRPSHIPYIHVNLQFQPLFRIICLSK